MVCLLAVCCVLGSGCNPGYTAKLEKQVKTENKAKGTKWMQENLPDAKIVVMETYPSGSALYNVVQGNYKIKQKAIYYFLNVDTGVLYTDESFEEAQAEYAQRLSSDYGLNREKMKECRINVMAYMKATQITNVENHETTEIKSTETEITVDAFDHLLTREELTELYENTPEQVWFSVDYELDTYEGIEKNPLYVQIVKEHPELTLTFVVENQKKECYYTMQRKQDTIVLGKHQKTDAGWNKEIVWKEELSADSSEE